MSVLHMHTFPTQSLLGARQYSHHLRLTTYLILVCPPRSHTWNFRFLYVTVSTLKPIAVQREIQMVSVKAENVSLIIIIVLSGSAVYCKYDMHCCSQ